jgi:nitrogenase molybdenum-iron protein NifN
MGGAKATVELGATLPETTAGTILRDHHGTPLHRLPMPIGIRATDTFFQLLAELACREIPERHTAARGRLIDSMVDGHKYVFGKRAVVYGEEDLVIGLTALLAEIGVKPVLCASGGKSGRMVEGIGAAVGDLDCPMPVVKEDVDFFDIETLAEELEVDLVIGHSKGYAFARRKNLPMVRVGFPIHDRIGGQRILHLGYNGAQALFDLIANTLIEKKQDDSPVGYSYM